MYINAHLKLVLECTRSKMSLFSVCKILARWNWCVHLYLICKRFGATAMQGVGVWKNKDYLQCPSEVDDSNSGTAFRLLATIHNIKWVSSHHWIGVIMTHQYDFLLFFSPLDQISQSWDGEKDQNHQRFTARGESPTSAAEPFLFNSMIFMCLLL